MISMLSRQMAIASFSIFGVVHVLPANARDAYSWIVLEHEPHDVSLIFGVPETDDIVFHFTCENGLTKLYYSLEREEKPYGTTEAMTVIIRFGQKQFRVAANATFDEGGSPRIETQDSASSILAVGLATRGRIVTIDHWGGNSAPAVPAKWLKEWRNKCGV